ncbi:hypothetical protein [Pseudoxanthomonas spadix]|nr:hypothetical protein [Pseudoxanthomonas spadix]
MAMSCLRRNALTVRRHGCIAGEKNRRLRVQGGVSRYPAKAA